jgi:hypothetical protein
MRMARPVAPFESDGRRTRGLGNWPRARRLWPNARGSCWRVCGSQTNTVVTHKLKITQEDSLLPSPLSENEPERRRQIRGAYPYQLAQFSDLRRFPSVPFWARLPGLSRDLCKTV